MSFRLVSYNVRSLRDDSAAVAAVLRLLRPDVVCIQEAPRFLFWRSKARHLADAAGLQVVTGGRPAAAMLLLARPGVRVVHAEDILLSKRRGLHQRGLAAAVLDVDGARVAVASLHLDLEPAARLQHAQEVLDRLERLDAPLVAAGDVNETPDQPAWALLAARLPDAYTVAPRGERQTYSAVDPQRQIDGVFADPRLTVLGCGVPDRTWGDPGGQLDGLLPRASDHRPLLAELAP